MTDKQLSRSHKATDQVTVPWLEWHNTREQLKEARRLLNLAAEAGRRGSCDET